MTFFDALYHYSVSLEIDNTVNIFGVM